MNCSKCGNPIPEGRFKYGYTECIDCSTVERVGCVDIVYHKTGNTIEILPADEAEKMRKLGKRSSFGTLSGMKANRGQSYSSTFPIFDQSPEFESTKQMAIDIKTSVGLERAKNWIIRRCDEMKITKSEMEDILDELNPVQRISHKTKENPYKKRWYSRYEPKEEKSEIDPEISEAFHNWRKF